MRIFLQTVTLTSLLTLGGLSGAPEPQKKTTATAESKKKKLAPYLKYLIYTASGATLLLIGGVAGYALRARKNRSLDRAKKAEVHPAHHAHAKPALNITHTDGLLIEHNLLLNPEARRAIDALIQLTDAIQTDRANPERAEARMRADAALELREIDAAKRLQATESGTPSTPKQQPPFETPQRDRPAELDSIEKFLDSQDWSLATTQNAFKAFQEEVAAAEGKSPPKS